jgi:DNA repair photolyase
LLKAMNELRLVGVTISITSLRDDVRRAMEPRTSSVKQKLKTMEALVKAGIPVNVNMAPIVPGINSDEVFELVKTVGDLGVQSVSYIMVRLNGQIAGIFDHWVRQSFPDRADKILSQIEETHGGALNASDFGSRMKGEGHFATQIKSMFDIARRKYIRNGPFPKLDFSHFVRDTKGQLRLF